MADRTQDGTITLKLTSTITNKLDDGTVSTYTGGFNYTQAIKTGVSVNQASRFWQDKDATLAAAATRTIDLFALAAEDIGAGAGLDALGQSNVNFLEIITFVVRVTAGTGTLSVEQAPVDGWDPLPVVNAALNNALRKDGYLILHQPHENALVVTNSSKNILLTAGGATMTYDVFILGRHDVNESSSSSSSSSSVSSSSLSSSSVSSSSSSSVSSSSNSSSSSVSSVSSSSSSVSSVSSSSVSSVSSSSSSVP